VNATTIDLLATLDPESVYKGITQTTASVQLDPAQSALHWQARERFLSRYVNVAFGSQIATRFAIARLPFPVVLFGADRWVYRAYLAEISAGRTADYPVAAAASLGKGETQPLKEQADKLKACLMSIPAGCERKRGIEITSRRAGIEPEIVEAFEALYFNVIDRQEDALYLAQEVYPDTRLVEFAEDYFNNTNNSDLLKRVAYNHKNVDLTSYLAGFGDASFLSKIAAAENREAELTKYIMGNGLLLTHTNLLNQRIVGMNRAATLLAASRQSGTNAEDPGFDEIVPLFSEAFQRASSVELELRKKQAYDDAGITLEVETARPEK
jgi:hypothetical protein